jgi:energy-coupling factor transporter ATP-binding protein EcfA2
VFFYKDEIILNNNFSKSTNIILDKEECEYYILTQSSKNTLSTLFTINYHNSIAIIGPFGSGKSSLMLYLNTLLSNNVNNKKCVELLKSNDKDLYKKYKIFVENKIFLKIKIIGEHSSFKDRFRTTILKEKSLKLTNQYLIKNQSYDMSVLLELINKDIKNSNYTNVLFSIDEFGKFIEFGLNNIEKNDIFDLQTLAEFVNKNNNYKLIISLHKSFGEYKNSQMTYSDWDKIQGRFENILFKDDYYEMLNILKETISLKDTKNINNAKKTIKYICKYSIFDNDSKLFLNIVPIHPFTAIAIAEIFTKHFQNQRSIFSFLFSVEPYAFKEFINTSRQESNLYSLNNLYQYIVYLLKVYNILLPDQEIWYVSEQVLNSVNLQDDIQKDVIRTIALIHSFKLNNIFKTDKNTIILALIDQYKKEQIETTINELFNKNILIFQEQTQSYSLIENSNININKELKIRLENSKNIDLEEKLNYFIQDKYVIAKRYFIDYGSKHIFEKLYIGNNKYKIQEEYKIFFTTYSEKDVVNFSKKNKKSLFICLNDINKLEYLIKKIDALEDIEMEFGVLLSSYTQDILKDMKTDAIMALESLFIQCYKNSKIYFKGQYYLYNSKIIQKFISDIVKSTFSSAPIINNYTLNHTITNKGRNTTILKKLFEAMLHNEEKEYLGIEKFPAHKALYLSIIKPSNMHIQIEDGRWKLSNPTKLNFIPIWKTIEDVLAEKIHISSLIDILSKEPFGLHEVPAMFIISLFILINRERLHIIFDNTYKYTFSIDLLMHMWKVPNRYQLQYITLSAEEKQLFKAYVQITTDLTDYSYSTLKVSSIVKTLYSKFTLLPNYAKNTQKISNEAKALRSALVSMKDPKEAFFKLFPRALGYGNIANISEDEFIQKFKSAFNEIALSYKQEIMELESFFAELFHFKHTVFPFGDNLIKLTHKLSNIDSLDIEIKALLRSFNYSNSFITLIDNISIILINKKIEDCYDNDINILKDKLTVIANSILSKLELADIATSNQDILKISLASLDSSLDKVISIDKEKLDIINTEMIKVKKNISKNLSKEEKVYLLSKLLNEELLNE